MHIFHFILGKASKVKANGVNQVVAGLAKYVTRAGMEVRVIGKANSATSEGEVIQRDGFNVLAFSQWGYELRNAVREAIAWADVVHLHGTYAPHNIWIGWLCDAAGKPYIVTPHSGLAPQRKALRGRVRKTFFHHLLQKKHLERAAIIHALTEEESTEIIAVTLPRRVVVVPNGVDLENFPQPLAFASSVPVGPIRIGYIGRLSREKNLPALCAAFTKVNRERGDLELLLAGPPSKEGDALKHEWPESAIRLVGLRFGADKLSFFGEIDLFVLPSLSEGMSISALESLALGIPMLITRDSNLTYYNETNAFFLCEPTSFGLEMGLRKALARRSQWREMALRGRRLIESRLNWASVTTEMVDVYRSMVERSA